MLNSRVAGVRDGYVDVVNKANESTEIPFGACVWATGAWGSSRLSVASIRTTIL